VALQRGDAPAVERVARKLKAARAALAQGECPASARSWNTSAHQEISRKAPNCWDESGRSWEGRAGAGGSGNRFQVKWSQPDSPSTGSSPRSKTTSPSVISPINVRGTSTLFASASTTDPGAQIRSS
jgi:hypothetical protein